MLQWFCWFVALCFASNRESSLNCQTGRGPSCYHWVEDVRGLLKREHGTGWGIEEQSGKVKFYRRVLGERKQAVTTNSPWAAGKQSEVIQVFATVRNRMEDLGICLAEAYQLSNRSPASNSAQMNWQEIAIQYEEYRIKTGLKQKTFNSEERYRIDRAILLINAAKNAPHDGKGLLKAYDHHYLSGLAPGSPGRKRNLLDVCRFLGFSVRSCGAPTKWLPPSAEEVSVLVGVREISPAPTVPVKPEQLLSLLESLTKILS